MEPPVSEPIDVRLVDLAAEHVRRYGLRRTTIVGIAHEAGMSHANVYRYFPSKEALIDAVLDQWLKPIEKGARDIADGPDPAVDKLERLASAVFRAYRRKLDEDTAIFQIFAEASAAGRPIARRHRNRIGAEFNTVPADHFWPYEAPDEAVAVLKRLWKRSESRPHTILTQPPFGG